MAETGSSPSNLKEAKSSQSIVRRVSAEDLISSRNSGNRADFRRMSVGSSASSDSGVDLLPNYLRASTGSCHDFCKFGKKHTLDSKARLPLRRRSMTSLLPHGQSSVDNEAQVERKRIATVKPKASSIAKAPLPGLPDSKKRDSSSSAVKVKSAPKKESSDATKMKSSVPLSSSLKPKIMTVKNLVASSNSSRGSTIGNYRGAKHDGESNMSSKHVNSFKTKSLSKNSSVIPLKRRPMPLKPSGTPYASRISGPHGNDNIKVEKRRGNINVEKRHGTSKVSGKRVFVAPKASSSPKSSLSRVASLKVGKSRSLKIVAPLKKQNKTRKAEPNSEVVREKTLHVVKVETKTKSFESAENGNPLVPLSSSSPSPMVLSHSDTPSLSSTEEVVGEESEDAMGQADNIKTNEAKSMKAKYKNSRKDRMVNSEERDSGPVKLGFRKGKVVDLQPESNSPRRLKFRRARVVGDLQNVKNEARRRSFKRRERTNGDDGKSSNTEKVTLRHQEDTQGKKDALGLFNNVIEETANKLVETRKSKVKALVGAFETIISLQESKPSANNVS